VRASITMRDKRRKKRDETRKEMRKKKKKEEDMDEERGPYRNDGRCKQSEAGASRNEQLPDFLPIAVA